jgi:lipocalin
MKKTLLLSLFLLMLLFVTTILDIFANVNKRANFIANNKLDNKVDVKVEVKDVVVDNKDNQQQIPVALETYSGLWVEVAKKNTRYSSVCYMVFAQYTLNPDDSFTLNTYCVDKEEENILSTKSTSRAIDDLNKVFEVTNKSIWYKLTIGTIVYKIYYINPGKSIIVVGTLDKNYLSILSRDELNEQETNDMLNKAVELGFNIDNIELTDSSHEKFLLYSAQVGY